MDLKRKWVAVCLLGVTLFVSACGRDEEKKTSHLEEGNALLVKGEFEDAEKAFLQAIALDNRYKQAYVQLGIVQMRRGDLRAAFASFTKAAELDPKDMDVQLRLATFHMLGRDFTSALRILDHVLAKDPGNTEALFLKGSLMAQRKALKQARGLFKKIIELDPSQVRAYLALVKTQVVLGETGDVVRVLHGAIEKNPHALDLKLALVDRYLSLDKIADAKGVLLDALQHDPGNPKLQEILGAFYFRIGQMSMAESASKEAVKIAPMEVRPLMHLARFYNLNGDEDKAGQTYARALELAPDNVQVLDTVSRFYAHSGKVAEAEKYVALALEANPSFLPSRILQTELALEKGDFDTTLQCAQALLDEGKNLPKINYLKGMALLAKGDAQAAQPALEQAVQAWPRFVGARMGLAEALLDLGKSDQARSQALVILKQAPENLEARLLLGTLADAAGDLDGAKEYYLDALQLDPTYAPAANNLAYILVRQGGDLDEALRLATIALEKMPDDALVLDTVGLIHLRRGEPELARGYLVRSVAKDANNPVFLYHLGLAHFEQGDTGKAGELLAGALAFNATFDGEEHARSILTTIWSQGSVNGSEGTTGE